ncbi:MAG: manganese efflux pump, partial [Myxococcales bacterium]
MSFLAVFAIAIALGMDAFAVAIASGVALRKIHFRHTFRLAFHFGLFQALMPIAGWLCGRLLADLIQVWDHWIALGLLGFIGVRMILESLRGNTENVEVRDPTRGWSLVMLSVGTSIDALAVGLSFAFIGIAIWTPAAIIGLVCLAMTAVGLHLGAYVGARLAWGRWANLAGE